MQPAESSSTDVTPARRELLRYQSVLLRLGAESETDFGTFLTRVLKSDAAILGVDRVSFWTFEDDSSAIRCAKLYSARENRFSGGESFPEAEYPRYFRAIREDLIIPASHAWDDERTVEFAASYLRPQGITSMLDVPVWHQGRLRGVLCHEHVGPPRAWQIEEQVFALSMAQFLSVGLERDERRRAEQALRESEERYSLLASCAKDFSLMLLDRDGHVRSGSRRIHGFGPKEVVGQHLSTLFRPHELEEGQIDRALEQALSEGRYEAEGWLLRKDGTRYWGWIVVTPLRTPDGTLRGYATVTRDLTEQRLAREKERLLEETRRAEERQRLLANLSSILSASLQVRRMLEPAANLMVRAFAEGAVVHVTRSLRASAPAEGTWRAVAARDDALKARLDQLAQSLTLRSQWGAWIPELSERGRPILVPSLGEAEIDRIASEDNGRALLRALGPVSLVIVPVRARRRTLGSIALVRGPKEPAFGPADLQIAEEVARRIGFAVDNARLYDLAREAVRVRDQFLSIAAHEFRTPLTTLKLQLQLVERTLRALPEDAVPASERRHVALALRQVTRLTSLVQELLEVSRVSAGMLDLRREMTDLSALVREVAEIFEGEADRVGSSFLLSVDENVLGQWDRGRLEQVLTNLLTNAIRYGSGKPIELTLRGGPDEAFLIVRDQGIGIALEDQQRIFGRFERAASVRHFGGLGLGLFIARRIVEAHHGSIEVSSQPGAGSTFVVRLPRWAAGAELGEAGHGGAEAPPPSAH